MNEATTTLTRAGVLACFSAGGCAVQSASPSLPTTPYIASELPEPYGIQNLAKTASDVIFAELGWPRHQQVQAFLQSAHPGALIGGCIGSFRGPATFELAVAILRERNPAIDYFVLDMSSRRVESAIHVATSPIKAVPGRYEDLLLPVRCESKTSVGRIFQGYRQIANDLKKQTDKDSMCIPFGRGEQGYRCFDFDSKSRRLEPIGSWVYPH